MTKQRMRIVKVTLLLLLSRNLMVSCYSSDYDSALASFIKKEKFNLELYELAFCTDEILAIIENDSTARKSFGRRISSTFDKRLNSSQLYFHKLEFNFLKNRIQIIPNSGELYPKAIAMINSTILPETDSFEKFSVPFKNYIEYPEQTDDACIIALISAVPKNAWWDIQSDELALYRFNNWIEFGFEEFRFYPGTKSKVKGALNKRIVDYITEKNNSSSEPMVIRSVAMINKVVQKYKAKQKN